MDDIYLDPFGEDSDLDTDINLGANDEIKDDGDSLHLKGGGFYSEDLTVDKAIYEDHVKTFDLIRQLFQDINNVPREFVESEAIITTLIQIVGVDQFNHNMDMAYHRQQLRVWESSIGLLDSLSETMDMDVREGKSTPQSSAQIYTAINTARELAARTQMFHIDALAQYEVDDSYFYDKKLSFVLPHMNIGKFVKRITDKISFAKNRRSQGNKGPRPDTYSFS